METLNWKSGGIQVENQQIKMGQFMESINSVVLVARNDDYLNLVYININQNDSGKYSVSSVGDCNRNSSASFELPFSMSFSDQIKIRDASEYIFDANPKNLIVAVAEIIFGMQDEANAAEHYNGKNIEGGDILCWTAATEMMNSAIGNFSFNAQ